MIKICFHLVNKGQRNIDYSNPRNGNPGVGGTQYMVWMISYYLKELYRNEFEIYILGQEIEHLPSNIKKIKCKDVKDAVVKASNINADIFVFEGPTKDKELFNLIEEKKLNSILWAHIYEDCLSLEYASKCSYIKRYVCVSKQQYDRLRDHKIFSKCTYIYNTLDLNIYTPFTKKFEDKKDIICFMGALDPIKGFHKISEYWPSIEKKYPHAELHVIGSGHLYNSNSQLGRFKLAEEKYEQYFMSNLVNKEGKIKDNIKFHGILQGKEKLEIMSRAKLAIVNPTGQMETFCIVAIEFEAMGIPVISTPKYGLLDTIKKNISGSFFRNDKEFLKVVDLYLNGQIDIKWQEKCIENVRDNFDISVILPKWREFIYQVYNNEENTNEIINDFMFNNYKWLREINRILKKISIFKNLPSILELQVKIKMRINRLFHKI